MAKLRFNKYGLIDDPRGGHCTMTWQGRDLLGEVVSIVDGRQYRGFTRLNVRFMNGEPWPIQPAAACVEMLERQFQRTSQ